MTSSPPPIPSGALHHAIVDGIVARGFAPTCAEIADRFEVPAAVAAAALRELAAQHGVVLHPHVDEVWVAHPFATAPTSIVVVRGDRRWWSNCAWCALGAATLVGGDLDIALCLGGEDLQVRLRVRGDVLLDVDHVVHFPIPMARAWDNVLYTCSVMAMFRSPAEVDDWCARHRQPRGDVRPLAVVWPFAREWYGRHLDRDWRKWTLGEAAAMFRRHGLTGPIWELPTGDAKF